ncbi:MAG: DNA-binding response regulator [Bacteroidetes bacterium RIFCSPLOWO2_02_FULL_36_8]|nr:MAG: DNA-binding response regulator [Bacteroidetes bacterium RIFCSPLOWO2_02_FULL_36_8]OFY72120.1 MAG: DNA-binding response regulator [Bacteroidetes bacterium RIFCSPLOWO2_12_FULL_37_12]
MLKILLVEDERKLASFVEKGLKEQGFTVQIAYDGMEADRLINSSNFDLIILDILLPGKSGLEVCKSIRKKNQRIPILLLTALSSLDDKVTGLESGADDYLVKPFEFKELLARVRALIRRNHEISTNSLLEISDLKMDTSAKRVTRDNQNINLTAKEFSLLEYLMRNKNKVISRDDIADRIWEVPFDTDSNIIDVYINFLRKKVDKNFNKKLIHTMVGMGYVVKEEI